jgi:hypothetical protein
MWFKWKATCFASELEFKPQFSPPPPKKKKMSFWGEWDYYGGDKFVQSPLYAYMELS